MTPIPKFGTKFKNSQILRVNCYLNIPTVNAPASTNMVFIFKLTIGDYFNNYSEFLPLAQSNLLRFFSGTPGTFKLYFINITKFFCCLIFSIIFLVANLCVVKF